MYIDYHHSMLECLVRAIFVLCSACKQEGAQENTSPFFLKNAGVKKYLILWQAEQEEARIPESLHPDKRQEEGAEGIIGWETHLYGLTFSLLNKAFIFKNLTKIYNVAANAHLKKRKNERKTGPVQWLSN